VSKANDSVRLDEILLSEGLVDEEQIKEALRCQKDHGGKFGSHLMRQGFINEAGLVRALSRQTGFDGVVLADVEIPDIVTRLIPARIALARKVLPFDYLPEENLLKIACENPDDQDLIDELTFVARGKKIQLFVAAELALKAAVARYYVLPAEEAAPDKISAAGDAEEDATSLTEPIRGTVLLVCDVAGETGALRSVMETAGYRVTAIDSADDAIEFIDEEPPETVFIRDTAPGDAVQLVDRLRKDSPATTVRSFSSLSELMLDSSADTGEAELLVSLLDLFTMLLALQQKRPSNHSGAVGRWADKLCRRLSLPVEDRLAVTCAGYLHDIARYYYGGSDLPDNPRAMVRLTIKFLESVSFPPVVTGILRSMYIDLSGKYTDRLPIEVLGGNILTATDMLLDGIPANEKISAGAYESLQVKVRELTGRLFLAEVAEAFISMISDEMLAEAPDSGHGQVMVHAPEGENTDRLQGRLQDAGFRTVSALSLSALAVLYQRGRPDMIVLQVGDRIEDAGILIDELTAAGVAVSEVPTFILAGVGLTSRLAPLLEKGIEDIIPFDEDLGMLVAKMKRIQGSLEAAAGRAVTGTLVGSRGSLEDMNLIDLLQALGPSRKTIRLTVNSPEGNLELCLKKGEIAYARTADASGADAVYEAINWSQGRWAIQTITEAELPEPNNTLSNDTILMEGCRMLDEKTRSPRVPPESNPVSPPQ
jgi:CheY-like chemotaxis protein